MTRIWYLFLFRRSRLAARPHRRCFYGVKGSLLRRRSIAFTAWERGDCGVKATRLRRNDDTAKPSILSEICNTLAASKQMELTVLCNAHNLA